MSENVIAGVVFLIVGGLVGIEVWRRLGGPDKDDPT